LARLLATGKPGEQRVAAAAHLNELSSKYDELEARIRRDRPHYAALTQPRPLTASDIQQSVLDPNTG
jgi:hypothetical protein